MDKLAASFAGLVKSNNGFFKSEKQAKYLLSMASRYPNNVFCSVGQVHGNSFCLEYHCDDKGVLKVIKYLPRTSKTLLTWERLETGKVAVQTAKSIKYYKRKIKELESSIERRINEYGDYVEQGIQSLFISSNKIDTDLLAECKEELAKLLN